MVPAGSDAPSQDRLPQGRPKPMYSSTMQPPPASQMCFWVSAPTVGFQMLLPGFGAPANQLPWGASMLCSSPRPPRHPLALQDVGIPVALVDTDGLKPLGSASKMGKVCLGITSAYRKSFCVYLNSSLPGLLSAWLHRGILELSMGAHHGGRRWGQAEGPLTLLETVFINKNPLHFHTACKGRLRKLPLTQCRRNAAGNQPKGRRSCFAGEIKRGDFPCEAQASEA